MKRLAVVLLLASSAARAQELGALETNALNEALAARGLTVDPAPHGKVIGAVSVTNLEVFGRDEGFLQFFNRFHRTTRPEVIRRETLFHPGDRYDQVLVDETTRNLKNPFLSNLVVIVPVRTPHPERVDVLIVTRDVWSLRLNSDFEVQQGTLVFLTASLSENNLFGWRKQAALVLHMDQGAVQLGPTFVDPNIRGTRLTLSGSARAIFAREDGALEGSWSSLSFGYPLYSLASRWGAGVDVGHSDRVVRRFLGTQLRTVDFPETPRDVEVEQFPWEYRLRGIGVDSHVTRSFPGRIIQRVSVGHQLTTNRPSFLRDFTDDAPSRVRFARNVFPLSERISAPYVRYRLFMPEFRVYRDLNAFDLREDVQLGPHFDAIVMAASRAFGSDRGFTYLGTSAAWSFEIARGLQSVGASWGGRIQDGRVVDKRVSGRVYSATPMIGGVLRVVAQARAYFILDDLQNQFYALGGENGMRGYTLGDLGGKTVAVANLELRSRPLPLAALRLGGVLFYDVGDGATPDVAGGDLDRIRQSYTALAPHHDFGIGLRLLIPHLNPYVLRLDWAIATNSTPYTQAGFPGRFSLGFRQVF